MSDTIFCTEHYELQYRDENGLVWWHKGCEYASQQEAMMAGNASNFDYAWRVVRVETTRRRDVVYHAE